MSSSSAYVRFDDIGASSNPQRLEKYVSTLIPPVEAEASSRHKRFHELKSETRGIIADLHERSTVAQQHTDKDINDRLGAIESEGDGGARSQELRGTIRQIREAWEDGQVKRKSWAAEDALTLGQRIRRW